MKWMDIYAHIRAVNILIYFMWFESNWYQKQNKSSATYSGTINATTRDIASCGWWIGDNGSM